MALVYSIRTCAHKSITGDVRIDMLKYRRGLGDASFQFAFSGHDNRVFKHDSARARLLGVPGKFTTLLRSVPNAISAQVNCLTLKCH